MTHFVDFSDCALVDFLWSEFSERLGFEKADQAVKQALDLNSMAGEKGTLPVLFVETCGIGLTTFKILEIQTGLSLSGEDKVLIFSYRKKSFQILCEGR